MVTTPTSPQEAERLRALYDYGALDTPPEAAFDELVALAAQICRTPISLVTLIDRDRQWFKARHGLTLAETPRAVSFCAQVLNQPGELLVIPDATLDRRFSDNPFVAGEAGIRFYAGVPLCTADGHAVGTLCVIDHQPRTLDAGQTAALRVLGRQVMAQLELRRNASHAVLNSARLENSQRIASLGDWEYDFTQNRLVWSDEIYRIIGIPKDDSSPHSETFYQYVHPDDLARVHREKKAAAEGLRQVDFEHRIVRPDGETRHIRQIAEINFDAKGRAVRESGTVQDITERHRAEQELKQAKIAAVLHESEKRYSFLADSVPLILWTALPDGGLNHYNKAWFDYTGLTLAQTKDWGWGAVLHPDDLPRCTERWTHSFTSGENYEIEYRFKRASDGTYRWFLGRASARRNEKGEILQWVGTCTDIDDQKHAEDELRRGHTDLEAKVAERTVELARTNDALQQQQTELRVLFDLIPAMIWFKDTKNRILRINQRAAAAAGKPISEIEGKSTAEIYPDDAAGLYADDLEVIDSGVPKLGSVRNRRSRTGRELWVQTDKVPYCDKEGKVIGLAVMAQDITERHRSEESLRLLGSAVAQARESIMITDAELNLPGPKIIFVNPAFTRMTGYTAEEAMGRTPRILQGPRSDRAVLDQLRQNLERGQAFEGEGVNYRKDGSAYDQEWQIAPIRTASGNITHFLAIQRDVTARKQSDALLQASEVRYRRLFEAAKDGVLILNARTGTIEDVNPFLTTLLGFTKAQVLGKKVWELGYFQNLIANQDKFLELQLTKYVRYENLPLEAADGRRIEVEFVSNIYEESGAKLVQCNVRDVTARKAAERALRESEERFKFVARAVSDVVWDWDLLADTLWWSDGFLDTFGYAAGEAEPGVASWTSRIHLDERTRVVESIHRAIDTGAEAWSEEYRFQCKDGHHAFVQDRGYILRNAAGKGVRMVGGMRDLTEQKKMEAQYLRAQRMESIGTLAGGIAHDLNNVLAPIMMSIELLKFDAAEDPRRSKTLDTIYLSCRRGADLVRQVLSFARGIDGQKVAIRLQHLIGDLEQIIRETFPRNIRIETELADKLWPITGDPSQLHQVLLNLAVNARDAMPRGGTLTLAASNLTIDAQYAGTSREAAAGTYVLLTVTDTGGGMTPEVRERIFEPFFTTKEPGKGTGIGLATVHTVVKSHGGFVNVESEVGRGTTFKIFLPADPALQAGKPVPVLAELPCGRGELVLVVDDELSIRDITQQTLEAFGYRVITASDGAEAAAIYAQRAQEVAVVITDMMMPVLNGVETIQVLMRINPAARIIAVSGLEVAENITKATNAGVHDFLAKPYTAETLLKLIRAVLDRAAATTP
jgi:PAS domain S-box-containing protein